MRRVAFMFGFPWVLGCAVPMFAWLITGEHQGVLFLVATAFLLAAATIVALAAARRRFARRLYLVQLGAAVLSTCFALAASNAADAKILAYAVTVELCGFVALLSVPATRRT